MDLETNRFQWSPIFLRAADYLDYCDPGPVTARRALTTTQVILIIHLPVTLTP
jgi:hypothetical protein